MKIPHQLVRNYARIYWSLDPKDIEQEAAVAALEAKRTWKSGREAELETYIYRAVALALRRFCRKAISPVSASAGYVAKLSGLVADELDPSHMIHHPNAESMLDMRRAAAAVCAILDEIPEAKDVLLLEHKSAEVAKNRGIGIERMNHLVWRARNKARRSEHIRDLAGWAMAEND